MLGRQTHGSIGLPIDGWEWLWVQTQAVVRLAHPGLEDSLQLVTPDSLCVNDNRMIEVAVYAGPALGHALLPGFPGLFHTHILKRWVPQLISFYSQRKQDRECSRSQVVELNPAVGPQSSQLWGESVAAG